jgi:hypothetical protein
MNLDKNNLTTCNGESLRVVHDVMLIDMSTLPDGVGMSKDTSVSTEVGTCKVVSSKDFVLFNKPGVVVLTISQRIWTQLREPFMLPHGICVPCMQWETVEFGCMGCRRCGSFHVCNIKTCPVTEIENNHVCTITGAVVRSITYDSSEYINTASHDTTTPGTNGGILFRKKAISASMAVSSVETKEGVSGTRDGSSNSSKRTHTYKNVASVITKKHTVSRCINFHQRICMQILCSELTSVCYEKEQIKLRNRLRWSFMRHVRTCKLKRLQSAPNLIIMISKIAKDIENYRLPIMNETSSLRRKLAYSCAQDIFKFTCSMTYSNAMFTMNLDAATMVIGLLYLLRSGLVHKNMTILPRCRALAYLLPPENYINMFGVKSKIITECENIVKCHLRTLSDAEIKDIGYETLDRVV